MNWSNLLPYLHLTKISKCQPDCLELYQKIQFLFRPIHTAVWNSNLALKTVSVLTLEYITSWVWNIILHYMDKTNIGNIWKHNIKNFFGIKDIQYWGISVITSFMYSVHLYLGGYSRQETYTRNTAVGQLSLDVLERQTVSPSLG